MKKGIKYGGWLSALLLLTVSCAKKEAIEYEETGKVSFANWNVIIDVESDAEEAGAGAVSTAVSTRGNEISPDEFIVRLYWVTTGAKVNEWKVGGMPDVIDLKTGKYRIEVMSHELKDAEWERPYYYTQQEFDIRKSEVTYLNQLICTQQNTGVRVNYSNLLLEELSEFTVVVDNGKGTLEYGRNETRRGYFSTAPIKITLNGKRHDGEAVSEQRTYTVKTGENLNVNLNVVLVGTLAPALKVDMTVREITENVVIPPDDDTIVDPDPGGDDKPEPTPILSVTGRNGLDITQPIVYPYGTQRSVVVDFLAEDGIQDLWVEISSPFLTEEVLGEMHIPTRFNLAELSPDLQTILGPVASGGIGLIGSDPIRGSREVTFDITTFTPLLDVNTHDFILTVSDLGGQRVTRTLTLQPSR